MVLTARIVESNPIRYTPAGLPALDLRIEHDSQVVEAGELRKVRAAVKAVAFGSVAERLVRQAVGSGWRFTGFLATPGNGKKLVLHVQEFQPD